MPRGRKCSHWFPPSKAHPFIDCLGAGHENADDCVTSLAVYRDSLIELNHMIASLTTAEIELPAD